ncbi:hypothetical protein HD593_008332 [Nonomuraea rubra]|uniref:Helix-turn-helix domain-containing protein n=1 Tax=Nonomuraea rubra TaxID=46180 RepID=A0A7X0P1N6_9ACTN|nr:hypothetical protein [Nonomuraea rubra]
MSHRSARLTVHARQPLVDRVQAGRPVAHVAAEMGFRGPPPTRGLATSTSRSSAASPTAAAGASMAATSAATAPAAPPWHRLAPGPGRPRRRRQAHPPLPAPDQRQGRTLQPPPARRMGLRPALRQQQRTHHRSARLPAHLHPPPMPHHTRRPTTDHPCQQPSGSIHLARTAGSSAGPGRTCDCASCRVHDSNLQPNLDLQPRTASRGVGSVRNREALTCARVDSVRTPPSRRLARSNTS